MHRDEIIKPLARSAILLATLFVIGTVGYRLLARDASLLDALYMTVITLTTVGYTEVIDLSENAAGRSFTIALLMMGVGTFLYFFSNVTAFIVEGTLDRVLWSRRMRKRIAKLDGHFVVCGAGHTGEHIIREMLATERDFVVVETSHQRINEIEDRVGVEFPVVIGDATDDEFLEKAGIRRAHGLVACVSNDKDNLIVTFSARILNPKLRIVCRCIDDQSHEKLRRAGANAVVSPNAIGGLRLVSELIRPTVVSFLDQMLRDKNKRMRVEEVAIAEEHALDGVTVGEVRSRSIPDLVILATRAPDGQWRYAPRDGETLAAGMQLIVMATPSARAALEAG